MKVETELLIEELTILVKEHLKFAENLKNKPEGTLNNRLSNNSWSVLECIEHLNLYGNFYLPEINNRIMESVTTAQPFFKSGWLGNYFANSMLPKDKLNKMKTFRSMNPIHSKLTQQTLDNFIVQQIQLLELLNQAKKVDLNKVKTSISITPLIKLRLGDTLRIVIYHNKRHIVQAKNILKSYI